MALLCQGLDVELFNRPGHPRPQRLQRPTVHRVPVTAQHRQ